MICGAEALAYKTCRRVIGTNIRNVPENVCGHKILRFSATREICAINGVQTLMDLQQFLSYLMLSEVYRCCQVVC